MKKLVYRIISIFTLTALILAQNPDDIIGKYRLPNQLDVEIFKTDGKYSGKIISLGNLDEQHKKDINNPDKSLRDEPLLGLVIIKNLNYKKSAKQWVNGSMYGPEKGLIFDLKITEIRDHEIEVVGSKFFFWKTLVWEKL